MTESRFQEDVQLAFRQANAFREVLEEIADDSCRCAPDWRCPRCLSREVLANAAKPLRPLAGETTEPKGDGER